MSGGAPELAGHRRAIDEIDDSLMKLLGERFEICRQVAEVKTRAGLPMMQPARIDEVLERIERLARQHDVDPQFARLLYRAIIDEMCRIEDELMGAVPNGSRV
jgi:chorismate mutase